MVGYNCFSGKFSCSKLRYVLLMVFQVIMCVFPLLVHSYRVQEPKRRSVQHPSDIELLLRDYQRAREETKTEIAKARDKLRERAEQEKRRIREQIFSQLQKVSIILKVCIILNSWDFLCM